MKKRYTEQQLPVLVSVYLNKKGTSDIMISLLTDKLNCS